MPTSHETNRLLASVRSALLDDELRRTYGRQIHAPFKFFNWINVLDDEHFDHFFTDFAGQGRIRWHYGVAHSLLGSFEDSFTAEIGRGWLPEENANRAKRFVGTSRRRSCLFGTAISRKTYSRSRLTLSNPEIYVQLNHLLFTDIADPEMCVDA